MQYNEIINSGTLVYKSLYKDSKLREWPIKEKLCAVKFYSTEPLTELDLVFLRLISSLENNKITKEEIALTLGFDVSDRTFGAKRFYRDQAEITLFNNMIDSVFKLNLVVEEAEKKYVFSEENTNSYEEETAPTESNEKKTEIKYIRLTRLGRKALEKNCRFSFFEGKICLLENVNKSILSEDTVDFPFYSELGFYSEITDIESITDYDPDEINIDYSDDLINRINLQSCLPTNVFEARMLPEWKYYAKYVDICLYQYDGTFYPVVLMNDKLSVPATDIFYRGQNSYLCNKKIKKALYCKLINNADSIINYNEICFFEDEIEQEEYDFIVRYNRTEWKDEATYKYIVSNVLCTDADWDYISRHCPEDIIISHLEELDSRFDFIALSCRLPIDFIIENSAIYKWNMNVVLSREDISKEQAQELMLCETNNSLEWDWDTISAFLDIDFVVNNIECLNFDFYNLTSWLPSSHHDLIVKYSRKRWNWQIFVNQSDINLVTDNIQQLQDYISVYIENVLDRIFTNSELAKTIVKNEDFAEVMKSMKSKDQLISYNLGSKADYVWSDELIEYLEKCEILCWNTSDSIKGFSQYTYVEWNSDFFKKYHYKIHSDNDNSYISEKIDDLSLITQYPDFNWDWVALSRNSNFSQSEEILNLGKDNISYREWMRISSTPFTSIFFASHNQWMRSDENASYVSALVENYDTVLEYDFFPWNWVALGANKAIAVDQRFCSALSVHQEAIPNWLRTAYSELVEEYFDKLGLSTYINNIAERTSAINSFSINMNIWSRLSSNLSTEFIYQNINENWDKEIISKRLISVIEKKPEALEKCKMKLNWNILSGNLDILFIQDHIARYSDSWDWTVLTQRLDSEYLHQHFKDYLSLWDQAEAINRITPLLAKEDIIDTELENVWNWHLISEVSADDVLLNILVKKADLLDWDVVSERICNIQNCDFHSLIDGNSVVTNHLDWDVLNDSMALLDILKYKDLQNASWNWSIITNRFDTEFIIDNLAKYATYWDWSVILNNKIERTYVKNNLEHVRDSISSLDVETKKSCWKTISSLYTPVELLELSETLNPTNGYEWDYTYVYEALTDPDSFVSQHYEYIDYKALSGCNAVNKMFEFDSETYVFRTWKTIIKSKLNDEKFKWDFSELTKLDSIQQKNNVFFDIKPDCWNWDYISQFGICLLPEHKEKYLRKYRDRLNFGLISVREDINIDNKMVQSFIEEDWNWKALSANECTKITFDFIFKNREKNWNWSALSKNSTIKWSYTKLRELLKDSEIKASISWDDVVSKRELRFDDSLLASMQDINFSWFELTSNPSFIPSSKMVDIALGKGAEINWSELSRNQHIDLSFVRDFKNDLNWILLTSNKKVINIHKENILNEFIDLLDWSYITEKIELTTDILVKYKDSLVWKTVNNRFDYNELDISFVEMIKNNIDWTKLSSASIMFTEDFLHQYRNRIDWVAFSKNESVDFTADLYKDFVKELNRVKFVETLSNCDSNRYSNLKVYHFSHMFNAIDIIKNRRILSRNKAEESKALKYDAAGAVVHRTEKAHPYARFYFRPKSPTQFYNECLGWDNTLLTNWKKPKSYYPQACDLHLPKCPMPVFFEFDIREIIAKMSGKCYYSSGNLQTNFASVFKIDDNPNRIRTEYLYNDISDAYYMAKPSGEYEPALHHLYMGRIKEQAQQEFLVIDELDFTNLESLKIFCYDEFQRDLLIQYLGDDEIVAKIEVNSSMYSYDKRALEMSEDENTITISSDYDLNGCAYILVKGGAIVNKKSIKNVTSRGVIIYPYVTFDKKNRPSEIYLMDPNPRADTKKWLIYKS